MRIGETPQIRASEKAAKKKSASTTGVDFTDYLSSAEEAHGTQGAAPTQAPNSFLILQEVSDTEHAHRKALKHGDDTIAALEQLHRDLLIGEVPASTLHRIQTVVDEQRHPFVPPKLARLLDDIELRAAVELAKLEQSQSFKH